MAMSIDTVQVYVTPEHDTTMINSDTIELTDVELDELMRAAKQGEYQLYSDCYGDDYAACVMSDLIMDV